MLCLRFQCGGQHYALDSAALIAVLPWPTLRPLPKAPATVAGLLNYHGSIVPVIDLTRLLTEQPSPRLLSSRIVLVNHAVTANSSRLLGMLVEQALETERFADNEFSDTGITLAEAAFVGGAALRAGNVVLLLHPEKILSAKMASILFPPDQLQELATE